MKKINLGQNDLIHFVGIGGVRMEWTCSNHEKHGF